MYGDRYEAYSAGVEASKVDHRAVKVMNEIGIDISGQRSKAMNEYKGILFDLAVTVCDKAKEMCPICGVASASRQCPCSQGDHPQKFQRSGCGRWLRGRSDQGL